MSKNRFQKSFFIVFFFLCSCPSYSQDTLSFRYNKAYFDLKALLENNQPKTFKKAVFTVENTFLNNRLSEEKINTHIDFLKMLADEYAQSNIFLTRYRFSDSNNFKLNAAIYKVLKDTIKIKSPANSIITTVPMTYDFSDFQGQENWGNMFVSKLLATRKGNCHSLPYLYKILADELGAICWLGLAPNHIYIKNRCKSFGWYNTELTSGGFPIDAWIMASGYLPLKAIQNAIYMDTLSNQQSIALCVLDLAKGYERQAKKYDDGFILKCCNLSLQYFPKNVQAMLLKAETLKYIYEKQQAAKKTVEAKTTYVVMEQLYFTLFDLGYREMPEKMYMDWLQSVNKEKEKYQNKQVNKTIGTSRSQK